jgi:dTDP-4-dehydrorhamnose reductase
MPEVDIADLPSVQRFFKNHLPEVVLNAAAYTDVDGAESHTAAAFRANAEGPAVLARACATSGALLVHLSTDYVFPGERSEGYLPSDEPGPAVNAHGRSKLTGEVAIRTALPPDRFLICRTQWLYGTTGRNFPETILRLAAGSDELRVVDDQWGVPTWTRELARQVVRLMAEGARGVRHTVNGGGPITWFTVASALVQEAGLNCRVVPCTTLEFPRPAPRPRHGWLRDPAAGHAQPWQEGLREYLASRAEFGKV